jgi:hypothetical protein
MPMPLPPNACDASATIAAIQQRIADCRRRALVGDATAYSEAYALAEGLPLLHPAADEVADAHSLIAFAVDEEPSY